MIRINSYDIDGVFWLGPNTDVLRPGPEDVIITGRSHEQRNETLSMLRGRGIHNMVFFNTLSRGSMEYGREASGQHKRRVIQALREAGVEIVTHFEDDPVQAAHVLEVADVVMIGNQEFAN